jgi:phosphate-selective porin OprO/OprP
MNGLTKKWAIGGVALGALLSATGTALATDVDAIDKRLRALEAEISKLRKEAKDAKAQAAKATNVANAAVVKGAVDPHAPPPVFVDLRKGLYVETEDKNFAFKVGGRLFVDGGGTAGSPGNGWQGNVGFGQARLEVEGRMKPWFYKLQYDFASTTVQLWNTNLSNAASNNPFLTNSYVTDRNFLLQGWRDAYLGVQDPRLSAPWLAEPVYFKIGSQYESFSLEALASSKYRDTIERPLAVDAIAPFRHLGVAMGMIGKDNWTAHVGLYSLSFQDLNMRPINTSSGNAGEYVPRYVGTGVPKTNWYQPWGGGAYWEATGRVTWAPLFDEHRLVHIGVAGSYHQPNSSSAYTDDRNMAPGNRLGSEANVLGTTFLGTPDLSCGRFTPNPYINTASNIFTTYNVSGNCVKDIEKLDLEAALSYNNFFVQGEYLVANYNRNTAAAAAFAQAQLGTTASLPGGTAWSLNTPAQGLYLSPGNSRYVATGGYVQGEWWITGEEKSQSYDMKDKNGVTFGQLKIKDPFSKGGWGAWGLVGRWSVLNLDNGPFSGATRNALLLGAGNPWVDPKSAQGQAAYLTTNAIANSGIYGGYQQNFTGGVNWYPDTGVAFQFNATHVMNLKSPLNANPLAAYSSHPTLLEMRAKVYF